MASAGLPATLHLVLVISTTCSLWFAWDQYEFLMIFRKPDLQPQSNKMLSSYFNTFFSRGAPRVVGLLLTSVISCGSILRYSPSTVLRDSAPWYLAGLLCTLGHQIYMPIILPSIRALQGDAKENNVSELTKWLRIHTWRSLTVDIAAWVCCIVATTKYFSHN
ncbi:hypothetical protein M434DRAFT_398621 [Hypoxylon sp. CO27-5]|nr:hypothetical protein M434DRAFT_398621 [Hypoxylon sp. CO27-5]